MRITIEATDDVVELTRARECIDAMIAPLASRPAAVEASARIEALALSARSRNALFVGNVMTVADLCRCTRDDLLRLRSFGRTSLNEVTAALAARGLCLATDESEVGHE
ncbi:DNA-directed RNA polymerase subunit alpha C-terminal domain-containing protein [Caballeronia sp. BR00000012568055]|uniref:DNA-directed RNA polymerase subunit alpha C-terminal domain-containing protein n=1 Tax=Caballeronia sp. BR00000012568055 TaxID=2918761 RepID=UPI0023F913CC|nr:DNA-directed RNA polymerase subunit alpha C-terminal domain-containing protein [Caballeronia sp. BR00000012568055]